MEDKDQLRATNSKGLRKDMTSEYTVYLDPVPREKKILIKDIIETTAPL